MAAQAVWLDAQRSDWENCVQEMHSREFFELPRSQEDPTRVAVVVVVVARTRGIKYSGVVVVVVVVVIVVAVVILGVAVVVMVCAVVVVVMVCRRRGRGPNMGYQTIRTELGTLNAELGAPNTEHGAHLHMSNLREQKTRAFGPADLD